MNQERDDCAAMYLGLQGFKVVSVKVVSVEREQHPQRGPVNIVRIVRIERRSGQDECPECGRRRIGISFRAPPLEQLPQLVDASDYFRAFRAGK